MNDLAEEILGSSAKDKGKGILTTHFIAIAENREG